MRILLASLLFSLPVLAADPAPKITMPTAGPETKLLDALVPSATFEGVKRPRGVETKDVMTWTCTKVAAGMYVTCTSKGAPPAPGMAPFEGVVVVGYDYLAKQYKGFDASMQSVGYPLVGKLDGKKLVLESAIDPIGSSGKPSKTRSTWDFTDPKAIKLTSERTDEKGAWFTFGEWTQKQP
jgi:hypothetical protein